MNKKNVRQGRKGGNRDICDYFEYAMISYRGDRMKCDNIIFELLNVHKK